MVSNITVNTEYHKANTFQIHYTYAVYRPMQPHQIIYGDGMKGRATQPTKNDGDCSPIFNKFL